jgi:hypothetical protein
MHSGAKPSSRAPVALWGAGELGHGVRVAPPLRTISRLHSPARPSRPRDLGQPSATRQTVTALVASTSRASTAITLQLRRGARFLGQ